jgi:thiol peroxidase
MAEITLGGKPTKTQGSLPAIGSNLPDTRLVNSDLQTVNLHDFKGEKLVISLFPSVNTGVCAASVRRFNELAAELENTKVINISMDLPFSQTQFCGAEGIDKVIMLSDFRFREFGEKFQAFITEGNFEGLLSRAVLVANEEGEIVYSEQVPEIGQEPDYDAALEALR